MRTRGSVAQELDKAKLEREIATGLAQLMHNYDGHGEWFFYQGDEEMSLCPKEGKGHGFMLVHREPEPEPEDPDEPWEEEGPTEKYALEVTVKLTRVES